jgi:hypothetical protein
VPLGVRHPYWWVQLDRDDQRHGLPPPLPGPAWPLTLTAGSSGRPPDPTRAQLVAHATASGGHDGHLAGWSQLVGADPVAADRQHLPVRPQPFLDQQTAQAERAQERVRLRGRSYTQLLRRFAHIWREYLQVIWDADDLELGPALERIEVRLGELATALSGMRASGATRYSG